MVGGGGAAASAGPQSLSPTLNRLCLATVGTRGGARLRVKHDAAVLPSLGHPYLHGSKWLAPQWIRGAAE